MQTTQPITYIEIAAGPELLNELDRQELQYLKPKSGSAELVNILVAVVGGAGLPPVISAIGRAIKDYFHGRANVETAGKTMVKLTTSGESFDLYIEASDEQITKTLKAIEGIVTRVRS